MPTAARAPAPMLARFVLAALAVLGVVATTGCAAAQQPAATPPHNELRARAYAAEQAAHFAAAADAFLELVRAEPDRPEWTVAAARCLGRSGRFGEALDLLEAAQQRFPGFVEVPAMAARTLILQAERDPATIEPRVLWADAAELCEQVLATDPTHEDARLLLAQARYLLGDRDEAVRQAEEAARLHPQHPGPHVLLGRIAGDRFTTLLAKYRDTQPTGQDQADQVAAIDRERQRARAEYQRAIELDPARAAPHVAIGKLAWLDGKRDEARAHLIDALALDPDTQVDHTLLTDGMTWQDRRDLYRRIRSRYEAGTNPRPEPAATLWFHEGRANLDGNDFGPARACFEQALAQNPAAHNAAYYAFVSAWYLDDQDGAERHAAAYAAAGAGEFAEVLRALAPEQRAQVAAIVQFLAHRAFQQQHLAQSRDLNHVLALFKDTADAWNNHAFLCRETGRFADAFASYEHALVLEPASAQLTNDAAVILQYHLPSAENLAKARAMYERALQLADAVLRDAGSTADAKRAAESARNDAQLNLAALPK